MTESLGKHRITDGDWICTDPTCANLNFARRTACNRCQKEKEVVNKKKLGQEIGKAAAEKSKGLFSADDWLCNKCCNINWARRQQCNMCNAPKYGDIEERTGYGGGYNDRGVVEYVRREESDDEYDEFGRKKKKRSRRSRRSDNSDSSSSREMDDDSEQDVHITKIYKNKRKKIEEASCEDEENEEDDSEDLSKYDLTEWDDLAAEFNQQKNKDRTDKPEKSEELRKGRSRSRSPW